jgi:hypothetical protein
MRIGTGKPTGSSPVAKVSPYHTSVLHYSQAERNVYHNNDACPAGKLIKPEHKTPGTAGRPLCDDCKRL